MKKILSLVMALTLLCLPLEGVFAECTKISSEQVNELEKKMREINGISSKSEQVNELEKKIAEEESWGKWFRKNKSMVVKSVDVAVMCVCVLDAYAGFNAGRLRKQDIQEKRLIDEQHHQTRLGFIKETVAKWVICKALDAGWTCVKNSVVRIGTIRVWSLFRSNN
ncbi:MAG: hypothetical protein LBS61_06370, partial [Endomicrobium sp.]|jgi:hypothetical protein|nr:hypothetical protein [Endomicrobium sp.]